MRATSTARVVRFHERQKAGRIVLAVEVDELALISALSRPDRNGFRFLQTDAPDREQIAQALENVVALWIEGES